MPLPAPELDNRTYEDIVAEAKARIPRYTPEWNDLNESDPGVTILELFAWMAEMLLYRLNLVPERNYVKFLELLDVRLRAAQPAIADLTFTLVDPAPASLKLFVPKRTRVAAAGGEGGPVTFETDEGMEAIRPKLAAVLAFDGFAYEDVTSANRAGDRGYLAFGPAPRTGSALLLGFDFAASFPKVTGNLRVNVSDDPTRRTGVHCDLPDSEIVTGSTVVWEYWDGLAWRKVPVDRDDTRSLTRSGYVIVQIPGDQLAKVALANLATPYYWLRARVDRAAYERPPRVDALLPNSVRATQAQTATDEVLGGSDGLADQTFHLFFTPVVAGSLVLEIDEGSGPEVWREVEDFYASGPDEPAYTLDAATGTITLGDGEHGRIPVANPLNPAGSVVARVYRYGGGAGGNLPPGTITQVQNAVDGVASVTNARRSEGGRDQETVPQAKDRSAAELKSRNRAVTAEDFEYLAMVTPGATVARAVALPMTHPDFPGVPIPGSVTVVVVPEGEQAAPTPTEATLLTVCNHLNRHRLLTTEVHVVPPPYRSVRVQARVRVKASADLGTVRKGVEAALKIFFHPLTGGPDGKGWPVGGTIYYSLVFKTVLDVDGVERIDDLRIFLDGQEQCYCEDVPIGPFDLLASEQHDIEVTYA